MKPETPSPQAFDPEIAHAMQLWLWKALTEQLIRQKLIQPWDMYQALSNDANKRVWTSAAEKEGFIDAMTLIQQMAWATDPRPYPEQPQAPFPG